MNYMIIFQRFLILLFDCFFYQMRVFKSDFVKYNVFDDEEMDDIGEKYIFIIDIFVLILDF